MENCKEEETLVTEEDLGSLQLIVLFERNPGWIHDYVVSKRQRQVLHDLQAWQTAHFEVGYKPFQIFKFKDDVLHKTGIYINGIVYDVAFLAPFEMRD